MTPRPIALLALFTAHTALATEAPPRAGATAAESARLTVRFEGLSSDDGRVTMAMWDDPAYWLTDRNAVREGSALIRKGTAIMVLENVPYGEYGISAYHDRNDNGKLDTGLFRIPKEPIGSSNDARVRFGPPKYQDAKFTLDQPELEVVVPIRKVF